MCFFFSKPFNFCVCNICIDGNYIGHNVQRVIPWVKIIGKFVKLKLNALQAYYFTISFISDDTHRERKRQTRVKNEH